MDDNNITGLIDLTEYDLDEIKILQPALRRACQRFARDGDEVVAAFQNSL